MKKGLQLLVRHRYLAAILFAFVAIWAHAQIQSGFIGRGVEPSPLKAWHWIQGPRPAPEEVLIVAWDDRTVGSLKISPDSPLPRELLAKALSTLAHYKPQQVILNLPLEQLTDPATDDALRNTFHEIPVTLTAEYLQYQQITRAMEGTVRKTVSPNPLFKQNARSIGLRNLALRHGIVERFFYVGDYSHFSPLARVVVDNDRLKVPNSGTEQFINFYGPSGSIQTFSFIDLLNGNIPDAESTFGNKIVFIGSCNLHGDFAEKPSGASKLNFLPSRSPKLDSQSFPLIDTYQTSFPGVELCSTEIHATTVANLLDGSVIRSLPPNITSLSLNLLIGLLALLVCMVRSIRALTLVLLLIALLPTLAYIAFLNHLFVPGATFYLIVLPILLIIAAHRLNSVLNPRRANFYRTKEEETRALWVRPERRVAATVAMVFALIHFYLFFGGSAFSNIPVLGYFERHLQRIPLFQGYIGAVEPQVMDFWYSLRGAERPPDDIVVVAVDDESYKKIGLSTLNPFPRKHMAHLLYRLHELGAKRVAFDFIFEEPGDPLQRAELADAMRLLPVVIGQDFRTRLLRAPNGDVITQRESLLPHKDFVEAAEIVGSIAIPVDFTGKLRQFNVIDKRAQPLLTLSEAGIGLTIDKMLTAPPGEFPNRRDFINYYGASRTFPIIPIYRVLDTENPVPRSYFHNKTVFVGLVMGIGVGGVKKDSFYTPFSPEPTYGVEIHATAAANLLQGNWIRRLDPQLEVPFLNILCLLLVFCTLRLPASRGALLVGGSIFGWAIGSYIAFCMNFFLPGATLALILLPMAFTINTFMHYTRAQKLHKKVKSAFGRYVSPSMVQEIIERGGVELGGQVVEGSALFTDIANSVTIIEAMPPERVSRMLNSYFDLLTDVVLKNKGTLIKFTGDGLFVVWGAPVVLENHAELALLSAKEIEEKLTEWNASDDFPDLPTRTGIHSGEMLVGNFGSESRFDYTAIGDTVNVASRMESLNKYFGTMLVISGEVKNRTSSNDELIHLGSGRVAGKKGITDLYTLKRDIDRLDLIEQWARALSLFQKGEFAAAQKAFQSLESESWTLNEGVTTYLEHIGNYLREGPPKGWRGEISFMYK